MRLTHWTDYALRVLMYCAQHPDRATPVTVSEVAEYHNISRHHLTKIVQDLSTQGYLDTTRGRGGGFRLARKPSDIRLGDVVRITESNLAIVECFDPVNNACRLTAQCALKGVLYAAMRNYFATLDAVTLEDLVTPGGTLHMKMA